MYYVISYALCSFFFFNDTPTTEIYTLSLHDALPISRREDQDRASGRRVGSRHLQQVPAADPSPPCRRRSEEHTSELQSRRDLVCRLLLEKKKKKNRSNIINIKPNTAWNQGQSDHKHS